MAKTAIRWVPGEWLAVAKAVAAAGLKGKDPGAALLSAQTVLPSERRHPATHFEVQTVRATLVRYLGKLASMSRDEIAAIEAPTVKRTGATGNRRAATKPAPGATTSKLSELRWTEADWARIARAGEILLKHSPTMAGDMPEVVMRAQQLALPTRRHMSEALIRDRWGGRGRIAYALGKSNQELIADEPLSRELAALASHAIAPSAPITPTAEPLKLTPEAMAQEAPEAFSAPEPTPASIPRPASVPMGLHTAVSRFAGTMTAALDELLVVHEREVVSRIEGALPAIGVQIAALIEQGMRNAVHKALEQELGGPVAAPAAEVQQTVQAPPAPAPMEKPRPKQLKVDIIGLIGPSASAVKDAFNGNLDVRFIEGDYLGKWTPTPERHCIIATKFAPHQAIERAKRFRTPFLRVPGGTGLVIQAIEQLMMNEGIVPHET